MRGAGLMPAMDALKVFFEKEADKGQVILGVQHSFYKCAQQLVYSTLATFAMRQVVCTRQQRLPQITLGAQEVPIACCMMVTACLQIPSSDHDDHGNSGDSTWSFFCVLTPEEQTAFMSLD